MSALAFAAGLGIAIASNTAVASAETTDASSSSSESSTKTSDSSESDSPDSDSSDSDSSDETNESDTDDTDAESPSTPEADDDSAADDADDADESNDHGDSDDAKGSEQDPKTDDDEPSAGPTRESGSRGGVDREPTSVEEAGPTAAAVPTALSKPAVVEQTAAAPLVVLPTVQPAIPAAPVAAPWEMFWAAARRALVGAFYNQAPTIKQVELGQSEDAKVTGVLGATDPDGDPLRYQIIKQAANGTVVVNADGTYVYTPNAAFAAKGGIDTFDVQVRDVGFRLFSRVGQDTATVSVLVSPDKAPVQIAVSRNPVSVVVSADGSRAYVGGTKIEVIDTATNTIIGTISTTGFQSALALSANGKRLYSANSVDGTVLVIDTDQNLQIASITVGADPRGLALGANGDKLYVTNANDGTVSVIDTLKNAVVTTVTVGADPRELAVNHDGTRIYVANAGSNTVSVIDAATNTIAATIDVSTGIAGAQPDAILVSRDGKHVYVANFGGSNVVVIDAITNKVTSAINVDFGASPDALALSADGKTLYVANSNRGTLSAIDLATRTVTATITTAGNPVAIAIKGNHAYIASSTDATVTVLTLPSKPHDAPKTVVVGETRGFTVVNLTSRDMVFAGFSYKQGDSTSGPPVGSVLRPGESHTFQVTFRFLYSTTAVAQYRYPGSPVDDYEATMSMDAGVPVPSVGCRGRTGGDCSVRETLFNKDTIYFKDAPGTVVNVSGDDSRAIELLTALCVDGSRASCSFKPKGDLVEVIGPRHQVGSSETNTTTDITRKLTFKRSEDISEQSSVKVTGKASAKIGALVNLEFSAEFGKVYTKTEKFEKSEEISIPPRHGVAWTHTTPFLRATGDFTMVMGNTTFHVTGANFDTPDKDGAGNWNLQDYPLPPVEDEEIGDVDV